MKVNIVLGTDDRSWILWDMARYIKDYNQDIDIEISVDPLPGYDVYHVNNDEMFDHPNILWHRALYTCHQFERDNKRRTFWAREFALRNSRAIGCVCQEYIDMLEAQGIDKDKIYYTPAGVDVDKFRPADRVWNADDKFVIGYVGRKYDSGRKGEWLLREILMLCPTEQIKIVFLGNRWDEEVDFCYTLGIECEYYQRGKDVEYDDYPEIYKSFDCLLITSKEEGGPVAALEALACGIPVITTPVGVTKDIRGNDSCLFYIHADEAVRIIESKIDEYNRMATSLDDAEWKKVFLEQKNAIRSCVLGLPYTWERWAKVHRDIYSNIYESVKGKIFIEEYMPPQQLEQVNNRYSQLAKQQIDPNHMLNFLQVQDEAKKGQGILGTKDIFVGKPAIIVGFGPSLDNHLDLLREHQDNFVVVTCDAAFPTLHKFNIKPDVVFFGDWTEKQAYNLRENGEKSGAPIDLNDQFVVIPTIIHPKVLAEINKSPDCPVFWYNVFDPGSQLMQIIPNIVGKKGGLVAGVLTTGMAFSFVAGMGCSPIIFIGHDLCYPIEDGKMKGYSQYASDDKRKYQEQSKFRMDLMTFPDINGNMVLTHITFVSFYNWINHALKVRPKDVINASECGILHGEYIRQMKFSEVCEEYGKENLAIEKKNKLREAWLYNTVEELLM